MNERSLYRRIARRETHGSRSTAVVIVFVLLIIAAVYVAIEAILAIAGAHPLLVAPNAAVDAANQPAAWLPWAGAGAALFGIIVIIVGVVPARRARHAVAHDRMVVVVDDGVLAGAIAGAGGRAVELRPDRVSASVSRSRAQVRLTPTSGVRVQSSDGQRAVDGMIAALAPRPRIRARVTVSENGVVGS